jgi:hypothetical protein
MALVFDVPPGVTLTRTSKSILSADIESSQSLDLSSVQATDCNGEILSADSKIHNGWHKVEFTFGEGNNSIAREYTVCLNYTVRKAISCDTEGRERVSFDWAHRWAVSVTQSRYEIEFVGSKRQSRMLNLCFGSTGSQCSRHNLEIEGNVISYQIGGRLLDAFFAWFEDGNTSRQIGCRKSYEQPEVLGRAQEDVAKPNITVALSIAISVGTCLCLVGVCVCVWRWQSRKSSKSAEVSERSRDQKGGMRSQTTRPKTKTKSKGAARIKSNNRTLTNLASKGKIASDLEKGSTPHKGRDTSLQQAACADWTSPYNEASANLGSIVKEKPAELTAYSPLTPRVLNASLNVSPDVESRADDWGAMDDVMSPGDIIQVHSSKNVQATLF